MLEAGGNISVGVHPQVHVFGLAVDTDIVTSTLLAMVILLWLGFSAHLAADVELADAETAQQLP